jgi:type IX secretion system PorP/SprF family membrane protein
MRKSAYVLLALCFIYGKVNAQVDPHFSQYYVYPSWLNPALTGVFDGDYRAQIIYRNQWGNVSSPYSTPGFSVDMTTTKNINVGASVLKQTAGDGGYSYTTAYGNVSYTGVELGRSGMQRLVFGIQAGLIQRKFDAGKLTFGDMWNPATGTTTNPTQDMLNRNKSSSFDAGAGVLFFDGQPGKKTNLFAGYSAGHLTRPEDQFRAYGDSRIPVRHTVHAGLRIGINESFSITPNALFLKQGTAEEKMLGAYGQYRVNPKTDLLLGMNYRFNDAFSPYVGFTLGNMVLGASYDVNTSELGKMVKGTNSFELSLSFLGRRSVRTPQAEFVCPRL